MVPSRVILRCRMPAAEVLTCRRVRVGFALALGPRGGPLRRLWVGGGLGVGLGVGLGLGLGMVGAVRGVLALQDTAC